MSDRAPNVSIGQHGITECSSPHHTGADIVAHSAASSPVSVTVTSITKVTEEQARSSLTVELKTFGKRSLSYHIGCDYYRLTIRPYIRVDETVPVFLRFLAPPASDCSEFAGATIVRGNVHARNGLIMGRAYASGQSLIVQVPSWQEDT
jgi:hypothetical protein